MWRNGTEVPIIELPKYLLTVLQKIFLLETMMECFSVQSPKGLNNKSRVFFYVMNNIN